MGFFDSLKGQLIEVIEWTDSSSDTIAYRFPVRGKEIKMGAQLTVRESQVAVFVNEGKIADVFSPGRYQLSTKNIPIITKLKSWVHGFNSPFKAEVYFINTKQFLDQKWGTSSPIMLRDADFGMVRLRARGIFSFKVSDPTIFLRDVLGTAELLSTDGIVSQLKKQLLSGITDLIAESKIPALDLAMNYDEFSEMGKIKLQERFIKLGLDLVSMYIENITLPPEVEAAMDKRTSMGVLGNVDQYTKFQAADALRDAAKNEGGSNFMGAGIGLGAGAVMGNMMGNAFNNNQQQSNNVNTASNAVKCPSCNHENPEGSKFCANCGKSMEVETFKCIKCNAEIAKGAKFCSECGSSQVQESKCPNCKTNLEPGSKFCLECGTKI